MCYQTVQLDHYTGLLAVYKVSIILITILLALSPVAACSSVVGNDSFTFQRDSTDPANITVMNNNGTYIESKPGFVHSVIFNDSTAFGIGGADSSICNKIIVSIGYLAHYSGIPSMIYLAAPFTWYTGGHMAYKSGSTVYYMTFVGGFNAGEHTLKNNEYYIVSNDAISTGTYRASDPFSALNQSKFAAGHHRYAIEYGSNITIKNYSNESISI